MSHYIINYAGLSEQEAHDKAIADIKDWLGEDRYLKITEGCKTAVDIDGNPSVLTWRQWRYAMFLSGIEGYPLKVWYKEIWPNGDTSDESDLVEVA